MSLVADVPSGAMQRRGILQAGLGPLLQSAGAPVATVTPSGADGSAAIQAAVDSLITTGGTVFLQGRYLITRQINVSSTRPINLVGNMAGQLFNPSENPPGLVLAANIPGSMIKYAAPRERAAHGGGRISGLNFYDATGSGSLPGAHTCTAALDLQDFALSEVDGCTFHWINGSAIRGEFVVMSSIRGNRVRYCGAAGKPALHFPSTDPRQPAQSLSLMDNRLEVCHGDTYVSLAAHAADCKLIGNGFEADPAIASSGGAFLSLYGQAHQVTGNHFNRNAGTQVVVGGHSCALVGNTFRGGAFPATALAVPGNRNTITGNTFASIRTGLEVDLAGPFNVFSSNPMYYSGGIRIGGRGNNVNGNVLNGCAALPEFVGPDGAWWISEQRSAVGSVISNNVLSKHPSKVKTTGGMVLRGSGSICQGNTFHGFNDPGAGGICIQVESSTAQIGINSMVDSTTLLHRVA